MSTGPRVVIVEDDASLREVLHRELRDMGFEAQAFPSAEGVVEACIASAVDVALLDVRLPGKSGLDLLGELRDRVPDLQAVMLTGHGGVPEAVEAMRLGAYDFLVKPTPLDVIERTLGRAVEKSTLLGENRRLRRAVAASPGHEILGESPPMRELRTLVARLGATDASVLVEGENGTGKELIARHLHAASERSGKPFLVLNCGAIPADLVESELFGHERGAFTGADRPSTGLFEAADGGTLFLDEIGELPTAIQPTLLRVLQFGEVRRVGSTTTRTVDVRIVAATNRDLREELTAGRFREDLYYRLAAFRLVVPPLRERTEDVPELARTFLARACARSGRELVLGHDALQALRAHSWKGNVRELDNAMMRLSILAPRDVVDADTVKRVAFDHARPASAAGLPTLRLRDLERAAIEAALTLHGGDKRAAAAKLDISLRTLYNRLKDYGSGGDAGF